MPVVLAASISLTACSRAAAPNPAPVEVPTTPPAITAPQTPTTPGVKGPITEVPGQSQNTGAKPDKPQQDPPTNAPVTPPPAGGSTGGTQPIGHVDPKPIIKWHPRGIGLPLTSDDPAAQGKKVVVLTFDDGPTDTGSTVSILETLAAENVKAMFFITGYGAKHMDLVKRIHREGHVLGPHTVTHANLRELSPAGVREELDPVVKVIEEVSGQKPKWLRPPYGAYNQSVIDIAKNDYGMEVLTWTDGSLDWEGTKGGYKDPNLVIKDTMGQLHPGAVVLMHDTLKHTAEALPELIKKIKAEGYEFVVLPN
ncbi:MAG: polysaccharide deacetylase [Symbiobacteriaceae bacterium]|nr:polysaccharide deacetylase [Symbiobacteriaceae bacterium]